MNNISTLRFTLRTVIFPCLFALAFVFSFVGNGWGQTELISSTGDGGFETGSTFAANGWTALNNNNNRGWFCGTGQSGYSGARSAFIGTSSTNVGSNTAASVAHLYKSITIPSGATNIQLSFKYKQAIVDNTYDYLKVTLLSSIPTSGTLPTTDLITTIDPTSAITTYTTQNATISNTYAGSTRFLVFSFKADAASPVCYGAIDDISLVYSILTPCTGAPNPGNTLAAANPVVSGSSTVLSLQNATSGTGVSYQWKSSSDNITYSPISGATSPSYSATPNSATYYVCDVTCSGVTTTSNSLQVNLTYCTPNVTSSSSYYITGVSFTGGISDFSNTNTGPGLVSSYSNYSASVSCSQFATASVNFNVSLAGNSTSNSLSYGVAIWVDWNNNYSFETSERMYNSNGYIYSSTGTFTIPSATPLGNYRMRVVADYNATSPAACTFSSGNGEVEDYTLTVVAQPTCMVPTNLASSLISYQSANISWTAPTTGTAPANYEYEIRTSGAAGSGATGLVTSGTVSTNSVSISGLIGGTTYTYYVRSSCGSGDFSFWVSSSFTTLACSSFPTGVSAGSITSNSATITWVAAASGSPSGYEYEIRTSGAAGSGATGLVASAQTTSPTVSAAITGLSPATTYSIYVRTVCYSGFTSTWTSAVTFNSGCASPTGLAASANSTSQTFTSISGTFTAASTNVPTGYIVVRSLSSTPPSLPASGSALPSVGNNVLFGNGYVVDYIGTSAGSWTSTNLSNATTYNFYIFSYNNSNCTGGPIYSSSSTFFSQSTLICPIFASTIAINGSTAFPGSSYPTLTAAIADIKFCGITQATILELTTGYSATSETYPIVLSSIPGSNSTNTITIREAANISGINITSTNTTATIDINSGQNWIIDGRPGGVGNRDLTIGNTNATNSIRFINEATSNTIKYCNVNSNVTSVTSGLITFSTTSGANGNDSNTIDNCDLNGGGTTANVIYASGTNTTAETNNSGVVISNNNIRDFYSTTGDANGVLISAGNTDWTISGNSFYWGASRQGIASSKFSGILITNSNGNNFNIVGNFIGGTAPSCGGTALTINGTATTYRFRGISLNVGAVIGSSVQNNTISNISWITSSGASALPGIATGIYLGAGNANIGNNTGNIISNFSVQTSNSGGVSYGIGSEAALSVVNISNNAISGIITTGTSSTVSHSFVGIQTTAGTTITINNNTIGSTTNSNSINASTAFTGATAQLVTGIANSSSTTSLSITNNVIANLNNAYVPSTFNSTANSIVCGISSSGGTSTINGNVIRNLYSSANATNSGLKAAVVGISATLNAGSTISQNTIYALKSSNATNTTISVTGIAFSAASTGSNIIEKNVIYNLSNLSPTSGKIHGIFVVAGNSNLRNNMVSLGLDDVGSEISIPLSIYGFYELAGTNNFFHNSVYISGSNVTSNTTIPSTAAFYCYASTATRSVQNNIFVNARSNSATSGGPKNYAIYFPSSGVGGTCNYNVYQATGQGAVFGSIAGGDKANFAAWQLYSPTLDPNSLYLSPTFTSSTDLHLNPAGNCSLDNKGTFVASVTTDIDGATRSNSTPDIGADEFTYSGTTATWIGNTSNSPSTTTNWSGGVLPTTCSNILIQSGSTYYPSYSTLTIDAGTTYTLQSGSQLTVTGTLTNNGTLTIESGATLVQGATSTLAGTNPVYIVKQAVTGAGGTTPNGRFWYIGSPVSSSSSSVLFLGANDVVKKRDEPNNTWTALSSGTPENLEIGRGYYMRTSLSSPTINFTGGVINNNPTESALTLNLTRTAGQGFEGFNLVCNPYPSYLDWDLVTKDQVENTIWYRTADNTNTMVFETYVSGAANGIGTNVSGNTATKLIPPMQSFWVRVASTFTSGSITLNNSMRSHFASYGSSTAGLRSTVNDFNLFLRMNLLQEDKKDQIIVYVNENSTNQYDAFDGEKMMQVDRPQFYTMASGKKIVINGLSAEDTQQSLPITMELTTTGTHQFMVEDLEIAAGNVWLEDKLKETYQLLEPGFGYKFFAYAGLTDDRFVLHLKLKDANSPSTPNFDAANEMAANHANVYTEGAGVVVIKLPTTDDVATDVQIYDAAGRTFFSGTLKSLESKIQLEQAKGIYYVSLTSVNGVEVRKVFID